mgnify:CR=1 FL=1
MASIRKEVSIQASPEHVWEAIRDVNAVHRRLAPGFVLDVRPDGDVRIVTFANGAVVRELIVDVDDQARRIAHAVVDSPMQLAHHHAHDGGAARRRGRMPHRLDRGCVSKRGRRARLVR